jgi:hypothetical protein
MSWTIGRTDIGPAALSPKQILLIPSIRFLHDSGRHRPRVASGLARAVSVLGTSPFLGINGQSPARKGRGFDPKMSRMDRERRAEGWNAAPSQAAPLAVVELTVGAKQPQGTRHRQQFQRRGRGVAIAPFDGPGIGRTEESADRNAEDFGDLGQASGTDPVDALFVFLNLLKGNPELISKCRLGQTSRHALNSNPLTNFNINRIRFLH